jgi:hypothetical protein
MASAGGLKLGYEKPLLFKPAGKFAFRDPYISVFI